MASIWYTFGTVDFINVTLLLKILSLEFLKNQLDGHDRGAIGFFIRPLQYQWNGLP